MEVMMVEWVCVHHMSAFYEYRNFKKFVVMRLNDC